MTFAAPWFLAGGLTAALGVVVLHLLAQRRPRRFAFPTARFVPQVVARAPALVARPADLPLLLFRVAVILLVATAFAQPILDPPRHTARVVLVDVSRAIGSIDEVRDSVAAVLGAGDALVGFAERAERVAGADNLASTQARGSLSTGLVAALRATRALAGDADSVELVIVSPFVAESWDAATDTLRALWAGRARLVRVSAAPSPSDAVALPPEPAPVRGSLALAGRAGRRTSPAIEFRRGVLGAADSAAARAGRAVIQWPDNPSAVGWPAGAGDTAGGVIAEGAVVVAPFARVARPPAGRAVAWWADGLVAATETPLDGGCIRHVAVPLSVAGDLPLRPSMQRLASALASPCGGAANFASVGPDRMSILAGEGPLRIVDGNTGRPPTRAPASGWLLVAAALLALAEPFARRREGAA